MATLRIEIVYGSRLGSSTIPVTGTASAPWAPTYEASDTSPVENPPKIATLEAFGGPIYVATGKTPDPSVEPRRLVRPGLKIEMPVTRDTKFSAIAAADITL